MDARGEIVAQTLAGSNDGDSGALTPLGIHIHGGSIIDGLAVRNRDQ